MDNHSQPPAIIEIKFRLVKGEYRLEGQNTDASVKIIVFLPSEGASYYWIDISVFGRSLVWSGHNSLPEAINTANATLRRYQIVATLPE